LYKSTFIIYKRHEGKTILPEKTSVWQKSPAMYQMVALQDICY